MEIFKGQNLREFAERFRTDQDCREYLSKIKWSEQYVCRNVVIPKVRNAKILPELVIFVATLNRQRLTHYFIK